MERKKELLLILKMITDYFGVCDANRTHNSTRLDDNSFSIHNDIVFVENITEDDLVDIEYSNIVDDPKSHGVMPLFYNIHSAFYRETDCNFFIHFHDPYVIAAANNKDGLLSISQESLHLQDHLYHKIYTGIFSESLSHDFSDVYNNEGKSVILIQGHGGLIMGKTAPETLLKCYMLLRACRIQAINNNSIKVPFEHVDEHVNFILGNKLFDGFKKYYNM